jgi:hypothetical protein
MIDLWNKADEKGLLEPAIEYMVGKKDQYNQRNNPKKDRFGPPK